MSNPDLFDDDRQAELAHLTTLGNGGIPLLVVEDGKSPSRRIRFDREVLRLSRARD